MDNKDYSKENKERMLLALATMEGAKVKTFSELGEKQLAKAEKIYEERHLKDKIEKMNGERATELQILIETARSGLLEGIEYYKIVNPDDNVTCKDCKQWIGKIVTTTGNDPRYPTVDDFIRSNGLHINCRCSLQKTNVKPITPRGIEKLAMNTEYLQDKTLIENGDFQDEKFNFNDDIYVQVLKFGQYKAKTSEGNIVEEILDDKACDTIIANYDKEILVDVDHSSVIGDDTKAYAWASDLMKVTDLGNLNGLYAKFKFTSEGKKLIEDRSYRFVSPTFILDDNNRAIKITSIALTNCPNLPLSPILNSETNKDGTIIESEKDMTKEEVIEIIKEYMTSEVKNECAEKTEPEKTEEVKTEEVKNEEVVVEKTIEDKPCECENKCAKNEEVVKVDEKILDELPKEDKTKDEVIKEEALNSQCEPIKVECEWKSLQGKDFWNWLKDHPNAK